MRRAPDCALDDEIVTMRPQPAASMSGTAACTQWKVPVRFTASMRSPCDGVMSVKEMNSSRPALVTTISTGPRSCRTRVRASSTARRSETSAPIPSACAPLPRSWSGVRSAASPSRSRTATRCPLLASRCAMACPMPDAAPVTTATRPIDVSSSACAGEYGRAGRAYARLTLEKRECNCRRSRPRREGSAVRIGLMIGPEGGRYREKVDKVVAGAEAAEAAGFTSIWVPQIPDEFDALTAAALMGRATSRVEIGTAVMPIQTRHPIGMAQQALAVQAVCEGRFTLGVGPSHHWIVDEMLGLSYERPARLVRDHLEVLNPPFAGPASGDAAN